MVHTFKYLFCALIIYIYIYSPALKPMSIGLDKVVFVFAFFYFFFSRSLGGYVKLFKKELLVLFLIALTSLFIFTIHNGLGIGDLVMYDVFLFIEILFVPYVFVNLFTYKWKFPLENVVICNSIIAGVISVLLLINPTWADIMKNQILRIPELLTTNFSFRGFGLSDGLTFAYPVVQGLCAGFVICGFVGKKPVFYLGLIPIFISIFVNARSGIIPIGVAIIVLVFHSSISKTIKTALPIVIVLLLVTIFYKPNSNSQLSESVEWGLSFFQIMGDFLGGKDTENMDALSLTGSMVQFPHSLYAWILGEGINIYGDKFLNEYGDSDIGYCIRTVYGGLMYMILWLLLWMIMFNRLIKVNKKMALVLFVSLIYLNWKSDFFVVTPSCRFFFFIYVCCIMDPSFMNVRSKR